MAKVNTQTFIELAPKFEAWGKLTAELFGTLREKAGLPPDDVPDDQAWFWTPEWQAMEKEADEAYANGDFFEFDNVDDAIKFLHDSV